MTTKTFTTDLKRKYSSSDFSRMQAWRRRWAKMSRQPWTWQQSSCACGPAWARRSSRSWWRTRRAPCSVRPSTMPASWFTCWCLWTPARTSCCVTLPLPTGRAAATASSQTGQENNRVPEVTIIILMWLYYLLILTTDCTLIRQNNQSYLKKTSR